MVTLLELARMCEGRHLYAEAEPYLRQVVADETRRNQGGTRGRNALAANLFKQKRWKEAEPLLGAAGSDQELAEAQHAQGKYAEEEASLRKQLAAASAWRAAQVQPSISATLPAPPTVRPFISSAIASRYL